MREAARWALRPYGAYGAGVRVPVAGVSLQRGVRRVCTARTASPWTLKPDHLVETPCAKTVRMA